MSFRAEFSEQLERTINTVLCAVQSLVKRREQKREEEQPEESRKGVIPNSVSFTPKSSGGNCFY